MLNSQVVKDYLWENRQTVEWLAAQIGKSVSTTRSLCKGCLPRRDADEVLSKLCRATGLSEKQLLIPIKLAPAKDGEKKTA